MEAMEDTGDLTSARGLLMLKLEPSLATLVDMTAYPAMVDTEEDILAMNILLMLKPRLSLDTLEDMEVFLDIEAMTAMKDMAEDITFARGLLWRIC